MKLKKIDNPKHEDLKTNRRTVYVPAPEYHK